MSRKRAFFREGKTSNLEKAKDNLDKFAVTGYWCDENLMRLKKVEEMAVRKNCTVAQISLAYVMNQKFVSFPIVTNSNRKRIKENVESVMVTLNETELEEIEKMKEY